MRSRTLYLVRHGALVIDEERRYLGQLDVPLSDFGRAQAKALQYCVRGLPLTGIYCSDLARSSETAEIIAGGSGVSVCARKDLREISLGTWEGCAFSDIARRYPAEFRERGDDIEHFRAAGGESFVDCSNRVLAAIQNILASSTGNILVVAHAGVNRLILCEALGIPVRNVFRIKQDYGCLNVLECETSIDRVRLLNFTPHNAFLKHERFVERQEVTIV